MTIVSSDELKSELVDDLKKSIENHKLNREFAEVFSTAPSNNQPLHSFV